MQLWTDLHVVWEVVEEDHLQQQLLSVGNAGGEIQGQEELLDDCELQNQAEASQQAKEWSESSPAAGLNTSTGASANPRPRFSDSTKALTTQVVRLSGTVTWTSEETESLWKQKPVRACGHPS